MVFSDRIHRTDTVVRSLDGSGGVENSYMSGGLSPDGWFARARSKCGDADTDRQEGVGRRKRERGREGELCSVNGPTDLG